MKKAYPEYARVLVLLSFLVLVGNSSHKLYSQINFTPSELNFNGLGNVSSGVTSLMYGPDGRLYVAEYPGVIKVLTIQRNSSTDYVVTSIETLSGVTDIVNHDDDGTINSSVTLRETTGLTVAGTAANPVIYVTSSDFRIGAGSGGGSGDVNLDTNSGIITRFTWNGSSWDVVDLVRGLPRSEENHATNGLEFVTVNGTDYLVVATGGITNAGSPSTNFVFTCEYALSGAVLSVNLDMINAMSIQTDSNGRKYIYDLPTLDDPTRNNANGITDPDDASYNGIDINDPFGGNDGLNQAMIVPGGPVQIFSPGYRNPYDLVVTQNGAVYVTDNGANQGWGGLPENEGGNSVTNNYDPAEPGSSTPTTDGELVNNVDHLELVTNNIQTYSFGSFYGGHPNPVRANPNGAGLFTAPNPYGTTGAVFRTQLFDPDGSTPGSTSDASVALPANWPPVPVANSVEADWRGPGISNPDGPDDNPITTWGTNTNGIDEYTATNFGGAMQGNLLAGYHNGVLRRVELKPDGSLQQLTPSFITGIGGNPLGITCNSDTENFPGTIWVGTLNGKIVILEPNDFVACINPGDPGYDAGADYDSDGYTNQDEQDNNTDHCDSGSQPTDFDKSVGGILISDLNDIDDDADGIPDANDPFQLGDPNSNGSDAFVLPVSNNLFNTEQQPGDISGFGLTGLMNNGDPNPNWLNWIDDTGQGPNPDDVMDGIAGLITLHMTSGTALGSTNTQEKGYQYGVQVDQNTGKFTVMGNLVNLSGALGLYGNTSANGGELGYFMGDGTQSNYIKIVVTTAGITALQEINDIPQTPINIPIAVQDRPVTDMQFYFTVDPSNGEVVLEYAIDSGNRITIATILAEGNVLNAIQQTNTDLAVGFIGSSNTPGVELEGSWDYLNVIPEGNTFTLRINSGGPQITYDGKLFSADQFFQGGIAYENTGAQVPELFQTEHTDSAPSIFDYNIPVPNGDYTVVLHFAEIYWGATNGQAGGIGQRIFDVSIESTLVLDNYDIIADVGSETPVAKTFITEVTDGELHLNFSALPEVGGVNQAKVSAIEIYGTASNAPPVAVASAIPTSGILPLEVSFTGSNSTDDKAVVGYQWDFKDGTPVSTEANPVHTFTTANTYEVELTVEDDEGLTHSTTITIVVNEPPNEAPVAVATAIPTSGILPLEVSFTGSNSTDDKAVVSYQWDFKDGTPVSTEANPVHTFTTANTYEVKLTVEDSEGLTHSTTITIIVNEPPNEAPVAVASATPISGIAPLEVSFTGSNSTDDTAVVSYFWDFKDKALTSTEMNPIHIFKRAGVYEVSLTVEDEAGLSDTQTLTVAVSKGTANNDIEATLLMNPSKEFARVKWIDYGPEDRNVVRVYLFDLNRQLIGLYNPQQVFSHGLFEIPISSLSDGVYLIGFETNKGDHIVVKLVVMN